MWKRPFNLPTPVFDIIAGWKDVGKRPSSLVLREWILQFMNRERSVEALQLSGEASSSATCL